MNLKAFTNFIRSDSSEDCYDKQMAIGQKTIHYKKNQTYIYKYTHQGYYTFEFFNSFYFNIVFKFAMKFSLVFICFINIFVSFSLVFILWTFLFSFDIV